MSHFKPTVYRDMPENNQYAYSIGGLSAGELRMIIESLKTSGAPGIVTLGDDLLASGIDQKFITLQLSIEDFDRSVPD